ncbi:UbiA family prenyltransferase [Cryobacterium sp. BB736]|uniref:UbiA family prenyltransferase n=1 Tax=Cryobacterium sp. BB736 TaxID=2746963 RepID=UPI0018746A2C|nr:UbiA family prenyltransferase [Cryobacterium sp. BB736]
MRVTAALFRASHPGPSLAVAVITALIGVGVGLEPWRVVVLTVAVLLGQFSVGLSNDWLDAERDRLTGRRDKPIASGEVAARTAIVVSLVSLVLAILLTLPLGPAAVVAHLVFISAGWTYNLWLKGTLASVVPYTVGFGSLPLIATLSLAEPRLAHAWAIVAAALLGSGAHFANALPDFDADAATGIRGLPHAIGRRGSAIAVSVLLVASAGCVVLGTWPPSPATITVFLIVLAAAVAVSLMVLTDRVGRSLFRLIIGAALATVAGVVLAGGQLVV